MKSVNYFSDNKYILLPTPSNPKVALAVGPGNITRNSFRLYTPFSSKAKILKRVAWYFLKYTSYYPSIHKTEKSDFISYMEARLKRSLIASVYYATDKNKIVIQLQSPQAEIIGYLKMSLTPLGKQRLENEKKAIEVLSSKNLTSISIMDTGEYEGNSYILYKEIKGIPACPDQRELDLLLNTLKKENKHTLSQHPKAIRLMQELQDKKQSELVDILSSTCEKTQGLFCEAYEHGDFAPWNIMKKQDGGYELFDFEYFETEGLEFMDLTKYHYQIGTLLKHKRSQELIEYVLTSLNHPSGKELLIVYLLKEINTLLLEGKKYNEELELIQLLRS